MRNEDKRNLHCINSARSDRQDVIANDALVHIALRREVSKDTDPSVFIDNPPPIREDPL